MATEDTELTFIRCPGCRSLVPAVATRCRMCGQAIEKQATEPSQSGALDALNKKSRVRQRTISVSEPEVDTVKENIKFGASAESISREDFAPVKPIEPPPLERPLFERGNVSARSIEPQSEPSDASQERMSSRSEAREEPRQEASPRNIERQAERPSTEPFRLGGRNRENVFSDTREKPQPVREEPAPERDAVGVRAERAEIIFENKSAPLRAPTPPPAQAAPERQPLSASTESDADFDGDEDEEELSGEEDLSPEELAARERRREARRERRRRKRARRAEEATRSGSVQMGGASTERAEQMTQRPERRGPEQSVSPVTSVSKEQPNSVQEVTREVRPMSRESMSRESAERENGIRHGSLERMRSERTERHAPSAGPSVLTEEQGALVGWFVNYTDDARGVAREIRAGRYFIGSVQLRDTDLVIEDESISTPHCMVKASPEDGFMLQDLMSERGTFVKKAGNASYQPCQETVRLESGDWLRMGNYEVMVCLVPRPKKGR